MDPNGTDEHIRWTISRRVVGTLEVREAFGGGLPLSLLRPPLSDET